MRCGIRMHRPGEEDIHRRKQKPSPSLLFASWSSDPERWRKLLEKTKAISFRRRRSASRLPLYFFAAPHFPPQLHVMRIDDTPDQSGKALLDFPASGGVMHLDASPLAAN